MYLVEIVVAWTQSIGQLDILQLYLRDVLTDCLSKHMSFYMDHTLIWIYVCIGNSDKRERKFEVIYIATDSLLRIIIYLAIM